MLLNRLGFIFDVHGQSMSIDFACSGSLVALKQGCRDLWERISDSVRER